MSDRQPTDTTTPAAHTPSEAAAGSPAASNAEVLATPGLSRRHFAALGGATALGALLPRSIVDRAAAAAGDRSGREAHPAVADAPEPLPAFRYPMESQTGRVYAVGSAKESTVKQMPVAEGLAGVSMRLQPGAIRELHWHALAAEWAFVVTGHCQTTTFDPEGRSEINNFGPGDVWYFPRGFAHSIQGSGPGECHFVLIFDNGHFSEYGTFSLTDWTSLTPTHVLAQNFGVAESVFAKVPKGELYIGPGRVPSADAVARPDGAAHDAPVTHKYRLLAQAPRESPGGTIRIVSSVEFPISGGMTGAYLTIAPGGLRTMHWHPNADEWQYYVTGQARLTVFGSSGRVRTEDVSAGDATYIPRGYGHHIENVGSEQCRIIAGFNSGFYQEIGLAAWMHNIPPALMTDNLGIPEETARRMEQPAVPIAARA
jgi:oxalate decarboxylase